MPFELLLDCTGTFRRTGITWAGASVVPPPLTDLARDLFDALAAGDFVVEQRPFNPHVTLARRCKAPEVGKLAAPIAWTVASLALVASDAASGAPRYRDLATWPLAAAMS